MRSVAKQLLLLAAAAGPCRAALVVGAAAAGAAAAAAGAACDKLTTASGAAASCDSVWTQKGLNFKTLEKDHWDCAGCTCPGAPPLTQPALPAGMPHACVTARRGPHLHPGLLLFYHPCHSLADPTPTLASKMQNRLAAPTSSSVDPRIAVAAVPANRRARICTFTFHICISAYTLPIASFRSLSMH